MNRIEIKGNRKDDLLEDALSDPFFHNLRNDDKPKTPKQDPRSEYELVIPMMKNGRKKQFSFDTHFARLKDRGLEQIRMSDYMSHLHDYYGSRSISLLVEGLLESGHEWTSMGMRYEDMKIILYDLSGLKENVSNLSILFNEMPELAVCNFRARLDDNNEYRGTLEELEMHSHELVDFLFGSYSKIPAEMKKAEFYFRYPQWEHMYVRPLSIDGKGNIKAGVKAASRGKYVNRD